jgi:hypothetical protein
VFCMRFAPRKAQRYRKSVARQRGGNHVSTTMDDGDFRGVRSRSHLKNKWRYSSVLSSEFFVEEATEISSACEDLKASFVCNTWSV